MAQSREAHAAYVRAKYQERRAAGIAHLGGACVLCGSTEDLHFDHIDPTTKSFNISSSNISNSKFWAELKKCQLLCSPHHKEKTLKEGNFKVIGHANGNNKLRELDVLYVRELWRLGHSQHSIAKEFQVTRPSIGSIVSGRTWAWLK